MTKDYRRYLDVQREGYEKKKTLIWTNEQNIKFLADIIIDNGNTKGICHGVRTGAEVKWFSRHLGADIIGTEIGEPTQPYIMQWDMNKPRKEWVGKFGFVFTNSHDHVYDPYSTFAVWIDQLAPGGLLILEHSPNHEVSTDLDPFGAKPIEITQILQGFGLSVKWRSLPKKHNEVYEYHIAIIGKKPNAQKN